MRSWRVPGRPSVAEQEPPAEQPAPDDLLEQIRQLKVSDVLLSTLTTVAQLAYAKLEPASRDLEQARLAIESMRAVIPVLEGAVDDEVLQSFRSVVSNLQLAYVAASESEPAAGTSPST